MFGLGSGELILVFILALIFIGPEKLPNLATSLGKAIRKFRSAIDDIKDNLKND